MAKKYEQQDDAQRRFRTSWFDKKITVTAPTEVKTLIENSAVKATTYSKEGSSKFSTGSSSNTPTIKKLLPNEIPERRQNGLCFHVMRNLNQVIVVRDYFS